MRYFREEELTIHQLGLLPDENHDAIEHALKKYCKENKYQYGYRVLLDMKLALLYNKKVIFCVYNIDNEIIYVAKQKD